jgi:hypothetical protein
LRRCIGQIASYALLETSAELSLISPSSQKLGHAGSCHEESVHEPRKYSQPATASSTTHSLLLAHCEPALQHIDAPFEPHATALASTLPSGQKHCWAPTSAVPSNIRRSPFASETKERMSTGTPREGEEAEKDQKTHDRTKRGRPDDLWQSPRLACFRRESRITNAS